MTFSRIDTISVGLNRNGKILSFQVVNKFLVISVLNIKYLNLKLKKEIIGGF